MQWTRLPTEIFVRNAREGFPFRCGAVRGFASASGTASAAAFAANAARERRARYIECSRGSYALLVEVFRRGRRRGDITRKMGLEMEERHSRDKCMRVRRSIKLR